MDPFNGLISCGIFQLWGDRIGMYWSIGKGSEVFKNSANFASSPGSDTKIAWKWMEHWWTWMFIPSNLVAKVLTHHHNTYREANEPMRPMSIFHFLTNDMTCATICVLVAPHSHTALSAKSARNSAVSGVVNSGFQSSSTKKWIETWKQLEFPKKIVPVCPSCPWWGWRVRRPARWVRIGLESWRWDLLRCDLAICFETVRLCSEDIGMCLCLCRYVRENGKWHKTTWLLKCSANV
jgi:hypothetical protein